MFRLIQIGDFGGDCTAEYDILFDKECTLSEFIDMVLESKTEWGNITVKTGNIKCLEIGFSYRHGKLLSFPPTEEYSRKKIKKATAHGGWSYMEYSLLLENDDEEFIPKSRTEINRESNKRRLMQFNYMLPRSLVFAFRQKVAREGRTQREVVIELLEKYID